MNFEYRYGARKKNTSASTKHTAESQAQKNIIKYKPPLDDRHFNTKWNLNLETWTISISGNTKQSNFYIVNITTLHKKKQINMYNWTKIETLLIDFLYLKKIK